MLQLQQKTCFTIGYGNEPIEQFTGTLCRTGIITIIDVRSNPYSRFRPEFNRENLEKTLDQALIAYRFMGDRLGGRYEDPALLMHDGSVDYRKVRETERFKKGIGQLLEIISSGNTVALMCAEKDPGRCHRFFLIAPALQEAGVRVVHIHEKGILRDYGKLAEPITGTTQVDLTGEPVNLYRNDS